MNPVVVVVEKGAAGAIGATGAADIKVAGGVGDEGSVCMSASDSAILLFFTGDGSTIFVWSTILR